MEAERCKGMGSYKIWFKQNSQSVPLCAPQPFRLHFRKLDQICIEKFNKLFIQKTLSVSKWKNFLRPLCFQHSAYTLQICSSSSIAAISSNIQRQYLMVNFGRCHVTCVMAAKIASYEKRVPTWIENDIQSVKSNFLRNSTSQPRTGVLSQVDKLNIMVAHEMVSENHLEG